MDADGRRLEMMNKNSIKRFFDLAAAVSSVIILSPLLIFIGFLVRREIGWSVLFWQARPGLHGKPFTIYKFRTMTDAIADSIRLAMMPEIEIYSHNDKPLLVLRVFHWKGPFYLKADGPVKGVYVRLGSTNRQAGPEILAELQRSMQSRSFDQLPSLY